MGGFVVDRKAERVVGATAVLAQELDRSLVERLNLKTSIGKSVSTSRKRRCSLRRTMLLSFFVVSSIALAGGWSCKNVAKMPRIVSPSGPSGSTMAEIPAIMAALNSLN